MFGKFSALFLLLTLLALNSLSVVEGLKCYHCEKDCRVGEAQTPECGKSSNTVCQTRVKTGAPNNEMAIRKCAIADKSGEAPCAPGYTCTICTEDLCNTASTSFKANYLTMIGVMVTLNYFLRF